MINGLANRSTLDLARELDQGGRFVVYPYCVSLLIITLRLNSDVYYVPPGQSKVQKGLPYVVYTLLFGWWGIPWGPIFSIAALAETLGGGKDVTFEMRSALQLEPSFQAATQVNAQLEAAHQAQMTVQQFARASVRVLAYALAANNYTGVKEMKFASQVSWDLFGEILGLTELDSVLRTDSQESNWRIAMPQACADIREISSVHERQAILSVLAKLLLVDGKVTETEKSYFLSVGTHLGLPKDDIRLVFETEKTEFFKSDVSLDLRIQKARAILSVADDATPEDIKRKYRKLALKYHPDRVGHLGPKVQAEAEKKFKKITEAKDQLLSA
jgi:DnaJ-domain-containing protein 1